MRQALPLFYCLNREAQDKLVRMITVNDDLFEYPVYAMVEWLKPERWRAADDEAKIARINRFMRQKPHSPKRVV